MSLNHKKIMFCPQCGKKLNTRANFCPSCGRSIKNLAPDELPGFAFLKRFLTTSLAIFAFLLVIFGLSISRREIFEEPFLLIASALFLAMLLAIPVIFIQEHQGKDKSNYYAILVIVVAILSLVNLSTLSGHLYASLNIEAMAADLGYIMGFLLFIFVLYKIAKFILSHNNNVRKIFSQKEISLASLSAALMIRFLGSSVGFF